MSKKDSGKKEGHGFVNADSLRNYAVATGSLTLVINLTLYLYKVFSKGNNMPIWLLICIALTLSTLYILSFFEREEGVSMPKYLWFTFLNSLMLFTSISGINGMLDSTRQQFDEQDSASAQLFMERKQFPVQESSVGSFFKHLIFPTHGWFNVAENEQQDTKKIIETAITNIDTTQKLTDTLIQQKIRDMKTIDTLYEAIDTLHAQYIKTLELFQRADSNIRTVESLPKARNILHAVVVEVTRATGAIKTSSPLLPYQPQQQRQKQQQQIQQLQQQQQKLWQQRQKLYQRQLRPF